MDLRNWEYFANTGVAVVGATVTVYDAILSGPHGAARTFTNALGASVNSTATNTDGMWEANGLPDAGTYDVKVEYASGTKWYKGLTKHNVQHLYDDTVPGLQGSLLSNGGQDSWVERGAGPIALPTTDPGTPNTADGWTTYLGAGDSGTAQLDTATAATNSKSSTRVNYTRSGGQATHYRDLPDGQWQGLRGLTVSVSFQVYAATGSSELRAFIDDGVGVSTGAVTSVVNNWATVTATRVMSASASRARFGVQTVRVDTGPKTFYVDNGAAIMGSVPPVFAPSPNDVLLAPQVSRVTIAEVAPVSDSNTVAGLFNNLAHRVMSIIGGTDWKDVVPRTLNQLLGDTQALGTNKVSRSGDSMSGALSMASNVPVALGPNGDNVQYQSAADVFAMFVHGTFLMQNVGGTQQWLNVNGARVFIPTFLLFPNNSRISDNPGSMNIRAAGDTFVVENLASSLQMLNADPTRLLINGNIAIHAGNIGAQSVTDSAYLGGIPAAGYPRRANGQYTGNGSTAGRTFTTGFLVHHLTILTADQAIMYVAIATAAGAIKVQVGALPSRTGEVLIHPTDGFTVGAGTTEGNVNGTGPAQTYVWTAFG